jgi:hypothetical protein
MTMTKNGRERDHPKPQGCQAGQADQAVMSGSATLKVPSSATVLGSADWLQANKCYPFSTVYQVIGPEQVQ